ncbi:GNAT family N-acetyltransferase [Rummeliibacillus sp. NPDC094406]|uniref:GNAT family N-acetyltransferase n=1 Tax=Rummeliibacillus sp. NPDC094406 TaxID=3364511 RepID=UPI0038269E4B
MELYIYTDKYNELIENYKLTEEQMKFTGTPIECIEISNEDADRSSILAIELEQLVTFFDLHKNEGVKPYSQNHNAILLRAFSTDARQQGKGYAKKALQLLPQFVKNDFSDIDEIVLAVNVANVAAQSLYKKCGFVDNGVRTMGKKGELIIMSYYL